MKKKRLMIWLSAAGVSLLHFAIIALLFDSFYYFVNDDYIIRDILSGRYSGVADAHIYNVIYPFAWILKTLYQWFPTVDFWAIAMIGLIYASLFAVLVRIMHITAPHPRKRILAVLFTLICFHTLCTFGIVLFTFTTTASICAIAALFLFVTSNDENRGVIQYLPSLILMLCSFCIRKDTFLMVLPFFGLWAFYLYLRSEDRRKTVFHLLKPVGALALCCAVLFGAHILAFSSDEWQSFLDFRDLRKSVHDFSGYPGYDAAKSLYESIGLSVEEHALVATGSISGGNTVFDTDPDIKTILATVGEYGDTLRGNASVYSLLKSALARVSSFYNSKIIITTHTVISLLFLIGLSFRALRAKQKHRFIITLLGVLLVFAEMFGLAFLGRMTYPVISSLLILAFVWITANAVDAYRKNEFSSLQKCQWIPILICFILVVTSAFITHQSVQKSNTSYAACAQKAQDIRKYCVEHSENIYFQPALIISPHSFDARAPFDSSFNNLITLGGWNATSPEYQQSLQTAGLGNMTIEEALLTKDNAYIIASPDYITSIITYFEWKYGERFEYTVTPIPTDVITSHFGQSMIYDFNLTD